MFKLFTFLVFCLMFVWLHDVHSLRTYTSDDLHRLREEVRQMFYHAYNSYLKFAYPYDELRPLSCDGRDSYGSYSLTLIDSLSTLAILGNGTEFRRVVNILSSKADFDANINVSVFETNIRIIGGLLSAHLLSNKVNMSLESDWPCNGPLLRLAEDVARRLLPAFETRTGMPYGTVNLRHGVPPDETAVTCTACIGTYLLEFGMLSRLTGRPVYEEVALNALYALHQHRSSLGLYGNHVDVETGRWAYQDAGIGSGVDSFFEYLVKGAIMFQRPELVDMFYEAKSAIDYHLKKNDWYLWATMSKGQITNAVFQSLEAYWPGVLSLIGHTSDAMKSLHNYHKVWNKYGFTPEFYVIPHAGVGSGRESYPLRPELIESIMYLYRATEDPFLLQAGEDILRSIQHSARTPCGYATIKDVRDHRKSNRMESFFLAETTKYLYLLFDPSNFIHHNGGKGTLIRTSVGGECILDAGGYVFNTEAHPLDVGAINCCRSSSENEQGTVEDIFRMAGLFDSADYFVHERRRENNDVVAELVLEFDVSDTSNDTTSSLSHHKSTDVDNMNGMVDGGEDATNEKCFQSNDEKNDAVGEVLLADAVITVDHQDNTSSDDLDGRSGLIFQRVADRLLKRVRSKRNGHLHNVTLNANLTNFKLLTCNAPSFAEKLAIWGQIMS